MQEKANCEYCLNYVYDEDLEDTICAVDMDEDEVASLSMRSYKECPYFQFNDEYKIVRKQN